MTIKFEKKLSGFETIELIRKHPRHVRFLENLPDNIGDPDAAWYLTDIDLRKSGWKGPARYVREFSEERAIKLVKDKPRNFKYLQNPTEKVCVALVERALQFLHLIPDEMRTPEVLCAAIQADPETFRLLSDDEKTPEICLTAVMRDSLALGHVPKEIQTEDFFLELVRQGAIYIHAIPYPSKAVCLEAVRNFPEAIHYINSWVDSSFRTRDDVFEVYVEAARRNPDLGFEDDSFDPDLCGMDDLDQSFCAYAHIVAAEGLEIKAPPILRLKPKSAGPKM